MTEPTETKKRPGRKSRAEQEAAMTQSPAFQAAVAAAVQEALGPLMAQMQGARANAGTEANDGDRGLMRELALSLAELTTQGTGKVKVSPEVLMKREQARERMVNLIIAARAEGKVATYQLRHKIYLNERIIEPMWVNSAHQTQPTEIDFLGIPNDAMVPVNDVAKEIFQAFKDSVGTVHGVKGVENGLPQEDRLGITRGGLVVRNGAINSGIAKATPELPAAPMASAYEEGPGYEPLRVNSDQTKGKFTDVHILGTIAKPAQQTV